jgi:hypothetical protein
MGGNSHDLVSDDLIRMNSEQIQNGCARQKKTFRVPQAPFVKTNKE